MPPPSPAPSPSPRSRRSSAEERPRRASRPSSRSLAATQLDDGAGVGAAEGLRRAVGPAHLETIDRRHRSQTEMDPTVAAGEVAAGRDRVTHPAAIAGDGGDPGAERLAVERRIERADLDP